MDAAFLNVPRETMTIQELSDKIQTWLLLPAVADNDYLYQLSTLYYHVTGEKVPCKVCQYNERKKTIINWLKNPKEPFTEMLNSNLKTMAKQKENRKYTLKEDVSEIVIFNNGRPEVYDKDTLTDEAAERILAEPKLAHNIETVGTVAPTPGARVLSVSEAEAANYLQQIERLTGENESLTAENIQVKTEAARVNSEHEMLSVNFSEFKATSEAAKAESEAAIKSLETENSQLKKEVESLTAKLEKAKGQKAK